MTLVKRHLHRTNGIIPKNWLWTGILLSMAISIVFYGIAIHLKETLRIFTYYFGKNLLVLSATEEYYYNFFYACLGSLVGISFGFTFYFQNSKLGHSYQLRLRQNNVINDFRTHTWHSLNWTFKVFTSTGLLFLSLLLHHEISFFKEFKLFFILLLITWFLSFWPSLLRIYGKRTYKWMTISLLAVILNSFLLTQLSTPDPKKINHNLLKNTIEYNYRIEVPETNAHKKLDRWYRFIDIFVGYKKDSSDSSVHFAGDYEHRIYNEISLRKIRHYLLQKIDKLDEYERNSARVALHIDKSIKLSKVRQLLDSIKNMGIRNVIYNTSPIDSKYPYNYQFMDHVGFLTHIPPDCNYIIHEIDSIRNAGYSSNQLYYSDWYCYRAADIPKHNRVKVTITENNELFLNHSKITQGYLNDFISRFMLKYKSNYLILFDAHDSCSYEKYIQVLDILQLGVINLRTIVSLNKYNKKYRYNRDSWNPDNNWMREIEDNYPSRIMILNDADKFLYEFVKED